MPLLATANLAATARIYRQADAPTSGESFAPDIADHALGHFAGNPEIRGWRGQVWGSWTLGNPLKVCHIQAARFRQRASSPLISYTLFPGAVVDSNPRRPRKLGPGLQNERKT